ncbi:MAG: hypothetical protein AABW72_05825 [archaeon]
MKSKYAENKLTKASYNELLKLACIFNRHGLSPIIIGGWAVYFYTKGAKSIDIDMILPSKYAVKIFEKHCRQYGFIKSKSKIRALFRKEISTGSGRKEEIQLDIFTLADKNILASDNSIEIPWKLAEMHSLEWPIGNNAVIRLPAKEVLLLYKVAALIDREYKLRTWVMPMVTKERLRSKIEKDKADILGLIGTGIDKIELNKLLKKTGFLKYFELKVGELK